MKSTTIFLIVVDKNIKLRVKIATTRRLKKKRVEGRKEALRTDKFGE
jgi:hypothetical protein